MVGLIGVGIVAATSSLSGKTASTFRSLNGVWHDQTDLGVGSTTPGGVYGVTPPSTFTVGGYTMLAILGPSLATKGTEFSGWTAGPGTVDVLPPSFWQTPNGEGSIDLNGINLGTITRHYETAPNRRYRVSWKVSANAVWSTGPYATPTVKTYNVITGPTTTAKSFDSTGRTNANMGWTGDSVNFTATSTDSIISFVSTTTGGCECAGAVLTDMAIDIIG
jgi:Protein of unknown function (DUF642)